ncbi:hypothetical protein E1B28_010937 [Marasmius oreades]|uniref:C2H2-type domain-containing protein n=1 Tax=Marasmius oreades TaxID=181124 RepID=A0A9P7UPF9_9AGAR|nr:uncharacterized protein E1B28_010937 [Marasmius oreades]KAG7089238.1 hypothetical protein E1B28_010937 [Marasmius oreades]
MAFPLYSFPFYNAPENNRITVSPQRLPPPVIVDPANHEHPQGCPYLTSYDNPNSPKSPGLSVPLSQMQLNAFQPFSTLQEARSAPHRSNTFTRMTGNASPPLYPYHGIPSLSRASPNGAESHCYRDTNRVRPTIQTEIPIIYSPSDPSSTSSGFLSSVGPPTPNTPAQLRTCPVLRNQPLPSPSDFYASPQTIDPILLQPMEETGRGRQSRSGPRRRSLSQGFTINVQPDPSGRTAYVQRPPPLDGDLGFTLNNLPCLEPDSEPSSLFAERDFDFNVADEVLLGVMLEASNAENAPCASGYHRPENNEGNDGNAAQGSSAFRHIVASEEVVIASKNRRTTQTPRFRCPIKGCRADFTAKHNLKNHLNAHNGVKKYGCESCQRKYTTSHVLKRHKKTCKQAKAK